MSAKRYRIYVESTVNKIDLFLNCLVKYRIAFDVERLVRLVLPLLLVQLYQPSAANSVEIGHQR